MAEYTPGDVIPHLKALNQQDASLRADIHREAWPWVLTIAPDEHYVVQAQRKLDEHRVLALFESDHLAQALRDTIEKLMDLGAQDDETGLAARKLARESHVRVPPT